MIKLTKILPVFSFVILFSFPVMAGSSCPEGQKCLELSGDKMPNPCTPPESNDCNIKDATVLKESGIVFLWQGMTVKAGQLPMDSWYKVEKSDEQEYLIAIYPNVGKHYILGQRDFELFIHIQKSQRTPTTLICSQFSFEESMGDQKTTNSHFDITIKHRLNYFYHGGPGSNPNPYTNEVEKILKTVVASIRIGKC